MSTQALASMQRADQGCCAPEPQTIHRADVLRDTDTTRRMPIPPHLNSFWDEFARSCGNPDKSRYYDVCIFGDSASLADELAELVLRGIKRATAGSLWSYEDQGIRPPQAGDLSIVTDWARQPLCIIETRSVEIVQFDEVTAEFAAIEGEGDGSLSYWRQAHRRFFEQECSNAGRQFSEKMLLVCEQFSVVYQPRQCAD